MYCASKWGLSSLYSSLSWVRGSMSPASRANEKIDFSSFKSVLRLAHLPQPSKAW